MGLRRTDGIHRVDMCGDEKPPEIAHATELIATNGTDIDPSGAGTRIKGPSITPSRGSAPRW
jgi:hypothetical protein